MYSRYTSNFLDQSGFSVVLINEEYIHMNKVCKHLKAKKKIQSIKFNYTTHLGIKKDIPCLKG